MKCECMCGCVFPATGKWRIRLLLNGVLVTIVRVLCTGCEHQMREQALSIVPADEREAMEA